MLVHGGERRKAESPADFFEARRVSVLLDELIQVVENLALTFGERKHRSIPPDVRGTIRKRKAKVKAGVEQLAKTAGKFSDCRHRQLSTAVEIRRGARDWPAACFDRRRARRRRRASADEQLIGRQENRPAPRRSCKSSPV